jgi:hypothetical protein
LKPGQFVWENREAYANPLRMVIVLDIQRMYVFDGDSLVGFTTVSTGKKGKETPTGVFKILQKKIYHESNHLRERANAVHAKRLTWDGIALHAGSQSRLPGVARMRAIAETFSQSRYMAQRRYGWRGCDPGQPDQAQTQAAASARAAGRPRACTAGTAGGKLSADDCLN